MAVTVAVLVLLGGMLLGTPIAFTLIAAGVTGIWLLTGNWNVVLGILQTAPYRTAASYTLSAIPMFILLAYITSATGLARDLFTAVSHWVSRLRGGLAIATVFACAVFGAMSGSSTAAATVMSNIAMPNMRRHGYSEILASGTIAAGSTLAILIPPSIAMVIFGLLTETSVGQLLIAGLMPGILASILMAITIYVIATIKPSWAPLVGTLPEEGNLEGRTAAENANASFSLPPVDWSERWRSLRNIWPSLLLIITMMGLLYTGIVTPTEVAAVGALAAVLIGVSMRRLSWRGFIGSIYATIRITSMIFLIIVGGNLFGYFLSLSKVSDRIVTALIGADLNRWVLVSAVILIYFFLSMFMDELPLLIITLPITFPLIIKLGFDPVWFGVISILNVALGMLAPPVGIATFVVSASAKVSLEKVYMGAGLLLIPLILTMILVMIFPPIATWLPSLMH